MEIQKTVTISSISSFFDHILLCSNEQIIEFMNEVCKKKGTHDSPMNLLRGFTEKENGLFNFLWDKTETLAPLFDKVKEELEKGRFIGLDVYKPYPEEVINTFEILSNDKSATSKKEVLKAMFGSVAYRNFINHCEVLSQEMWADNQ